MEKHDYYFAVKQGFVQATAGATAGFVEICLMHPLDVVKTRLQLQRGISSSVAGTVIYTGVLDCFKKIYLHEGLYSLYKGIVPPVVSQTLQKTFRFLFFEQYKTLFMFYGSKPTPVTYCLAGLCAGSSEAIYTNPFEVVKVTQQANRAKFDQVPSAWHVYRVIISNNGLKGIYKALPVTMFKNGIFSSTYFGFYYSLKDILPERKDTVADFFRKWSLGFMAGIAGSCTSFPFDVVKSRLQAPQSLPIKYTTTLPSFLSIYHEEGWRALYKGLTPKLIRAGPGGGILIVVYEKVENFLQDKFVK